MYMIHIVRIKDMTPNSGRKFCSWMSLNLLSLIHLLSLFLSFICLSIFLQIYLYPVPRIVFANIIILPGHINKRKSVLEIKKNVLFKL